MTGHVWQGGATDGSDSLFAGLPDPDTATATYPTLDYEVTGRIARITFNRPEHGNTITPDTPLDLAYAVERADLDPRVHVIVVSGRGSGFSGGYDLGMFAEQLTPEPAGTPHATHPRAGTVLDPIVQARNHEPSRTWDPVVDYAMMSRFNRGFRDAAAREQAHRRQAARVLPRRRRRHRPVRRPDHRRVRHEDRLPAGSGVGRTSRRHVGPPHRRPTREAAAVHRRHDHRCRSRRVGPGHRGAIAGRARRAHRNPARADQPAADQPARHDQARAELGPDRAGVAISGTIGTLLDGIARHTREGYSFVERAVDAGFRQAVRDRDEPFGDAGRTVFRG